MSFPLVGNLSGFLSFRLVRNLSVTTPYPPLLRGNKKDARQSGMTEWRKDCGQAAMTKSGIFGAKNQNL